MEIVGVRIDVNELAKMSQSLTSRMQEIEKEVYELGGGEFNIASPMQVGEVLFERLKIDPKAKRTKGGAYSTAEDVLEKYRKSHPIVDKILQIRGLRKLLSTYINALPELINPTTGKIHTSYNQTVTATGRISSANPNLQNIPVRTDDGREIRRAFIADDGCLFYSADYSQIELRLIADMSGDENMIEAFNSGADIHRATAAKVYGVSLEEVTDDQRRYAKTANFGIIYGISAFGLSERLSIPRADAKKLIDGYYVSYPQMRQYMDETLEKVRKEGYVSTIKGRRRYLPDINSRNAVVRGYAERNAVNAPIQGSAADIIKVAMIDIARDFAKEGLRSKMIMQVHDELVFNVVPEELDRVQEIVKRDMENAYHGRVALTVAAGVGNNWLEAH
jgi:DNA polymerase-1